MVTTRSKPRPRAAGAASSPPAVIDVAVTSRPRVRDRIFETACALFYKHGLRDVGVDAIAVEAGTNKMSFYRSFPSKDELIAEYLRGQVRQHWQCWDDTIAPFAGDPRRQIEALFQFYVGRTCESGSRGCALANVAVEIPEGTHPGRQVALDAKIEMRRRFRALAKSAGAKKADELGDALMLVNEGGYLTRLTFSCNQGPIQSAMPIVRALLDAYGAKPRK